MMRKICNVRTRKRVGGSISPSNSSMKPTTWPTKPADKSTASCPTWNQSPTHGGSERTVLNITCNVQTFQRVNEHVREDRIEYEV